jgi:hypothetical protein
VTLRRFAGARPSPRSPAAQPPQPTRCASRTGGSSDHVTLQRGAGVVLVKFQNGRISVPLDGAQSA